MKLKRKKSEAYCHASKGGIAKRRQKRHDSRRSGREEDFIDEMMEKKSHIDKLDQGIELKMIHVEGGKFTMGQDDYWGYTPHEVELSDFYIGKYPVTQAQWKSIMGKNPSYYQGDDRPVEEVSWNDCQKFISKLNKQTGKMYRLPTEAEWEYAARGGQLSEGYVYAGSNKLDEVGWYRENSDEETKDVGLLQPNELGLYEMSGNVYEWCQDLFDKEYYKECASKGLVSNPQGPTTGSSRVIRGGYWFNNPEYCRVANRDWSGPDYAHDNIGFRLVLPSSLVESHQNLPARPVK